MPVREVKMYQAYCCNPDCDVPGPMATSPARATWDAMVVGWETLFSMTICPRCWEAGKLPSDIEDARVTLPAATPDVSVVVEGTPHA